MKDSGSSWQLYITKKKNYNITQESLEFMLYNKDNNEKITQILYMLHYLLKHYKEKKEYDKNELLLSNIERN